ncbi:MAG: zinc ribbon domain-containing protein [Casimicrobiaceae bacterium]|nr:zinc ribbon domain-containing protein [Casimicrobiaceae bacterium]
MEEVFCMACGQKIPATASFCHHCGAQQAGMSAAAAPTQQAAPPAPTAAALPEGVKGWSWGACWLSWIWAIFNKVWIGLLALIPIVNLAMMIVLGLKGREWAWQKGGWRDVEHFRQVQKKWDLAGWIVLALGFVLGIAGAVMEARMKDGGGGGEVSMSLPMDDEKPKSARANKGPYPLPELQFSQTDLLGALKRAEVEDHWRKEYLVYLNQPEKFWAECVARNAGYAQIMGSLSKEEAERHGVDTCLGRAGIYYACLDQTSLDEAVACLAQDALDVATHGD